MSHPLWKSVTQLENRAGVLHFEGCDVRELAKEFGTPLYVYSESRIRSNYRRLVDTYKKEYPNTKIYYAIKANSNPALVKILASEGAGADASCIQEIQIAKLAGILTEDILYSGVYNSNQELHDAVSEHVKLNIEDISQLERLEGTDIPQFLCFRVNPGITSSGSEGLIFAGPDAKFGIIERDIEKAYKKAKELGVQKFGIHMMTGSNILDPSYFEEVVEKLLDIAGPMAKKLQITFDFIDIGGSLGVPMHPDQKELDIEKVAKAVVKKMRQKLIQYDMGEPLLLLEPGRYLLSDAGILLSHVTSIKESHKRFIGLDAGMQTLLRPALYDAYHHIVYANDVNAVCDEKVHVVGQVCENTDILAKDRLLPSHISVGDLLAIFNAGAYGFCMSSQYNNRPRPAEVLVTKGNAELIRERESFKHLIQSVRIPKHL